MLYDDDAQKQVQELFNSTDKIFLMGAGCSVCAGLPLMDCLTKEVTREASEETKKILDVVQAEVEGNIEDILSQLINYLAITEKRKNNSLQIQIGTLPCKKDDLQAAVQEIKGRVADIISIERKISEEHLKFVRAIHRTQRPGRNSISTSTYYVVLNYDTLLEDALGFEGISYADGMSGGATGYWKPQIFSKPDLQAKVLNLHGSLDWYRDADSGAIRRLPQHMAKEIEAQRIIIAPAESKYAETQSEPYATLMKQFEEKLNNSSRDTSLFIMGYGFGDDHVNSRIEGALRKNENLTVVALTNSNPDEEKLKDWCENSTTSERLIICAEKVFISKHNKRELTDAHDWWKFEKFVELVGEGK